MVTRLRSPTVDTVLRLGQWGLLAAACVLCARAATRPAITAADPPRPPTSKPTAIAEESSKPLEWYAVIWQRDLRQPPVPPKTDAEQQTPEPPPVPLPKLLGTFVEQDDRWAHFVTDDGKTRICKLNDAIAAFRVLAIEPGRAQLANGADRHWVEVPKPDGPGLEP